MTIFYAVCHHCTLLLTKSPERSLLHVALGTFVVKNWRKVTAKRHRLTISKDRRVSEHTDEKERRLYSAVVRDQRNVCTPSQPQANRSTDSACPLTQTDTRFVTSAKKDM